LTTLELLQDRTPGNVSELAWRIGSPLSALILALLAIPLSFVNPRAGRSYNLIVAVVIYMVYNNMQGVTTTWLSQSKISVALGLWGLHVLMLAVLALMFYNRLSVFSWRRLLR